jgi:hypothetical protein
MAAQVTVTLKVIVTFLTADRPHPPDDEITEDICQNHFMIFVHCCLDRNPLYSALLND